jgi:hypothetical protein
LSSLSARLNRNDHTYKYAGFLSQLSAGADSSISSSSDIIVIQDHSNQDRRITSIFTFSEGQDIKREMFKRSLSVDYHFG